MSAAPTTQTETAVVPPTPAPLAGLRERAATQRRRQNRLAIALIMVLVLGALAVYIPQRRAIDATRIELARTEAELAANQGKAAVLPELISAVSTLRKQVDQYKPLRGRSDVERALHEISVINTNTQLAGYKYESVPDFQRSVCREQPLRITFQADFVDAMSFIQKLEAMDRLTRLRELSIQKRDVASSGSTKGKGGEVEVTMSLSIFFDPSLEAAK